MTTAISQIEALRREIIALFEGQDRRLTETREDAREARDAATKLTERLTSQDVPTKLAEMRGQMDAGFSASRADLQNVSDKITREFREKHAGHEVRIEALEAFRQRLEGASGLLGWLGKNTPWLITVIMAVAAAVGLKDKLP